MPTNRIPFPKGIIFRIHQAFSLNKPFDMPMESRPINLILGEEEGGVLKYLGQFPLTLHSGDSRLLNALFYAACQRAFAQQ